MSNQGRYIKVPKRLTLEKCKRLIFEYQELMANIPPDELHRIIKTKQRLEGVKR